MKGKPFERLPQPSEGIWIARLDDTELPDEGYPIPAAGRVLEFAFHAGDPWRDWPTEDAEGLMVRRRAQRVAPGTTPWRRPLRRGGHGALRGR